MRAAKRARATDRDTHCERSEQQRGGKDERSESCFMHKREGTKGGERRRKKERRKEGKKERRAE